jgi:hypothetical protein
MEPILKQIRSPIIINQISKVESKKIIKKKMTRITYIGGQRNAASQTNFFF